MDFGVIELPTSAQLDPNAPADVTLAQIWLYSESNSSDIYLYDLWLIPVDEWAGVITDTARDADGFYVEAPNSAIARNNVAELDSITLPAVQLAATVKMDKSLQRTKASYSTDCIGPLTFRPNIDQHLWFLSASYFVATGAHTGANNAAVLTDATGDFINRGVKGGDIVINTTDPGESEAIITGVTSTTISGVLHDGTDNDWDIGDEYYIITDNLVSYPETCYKLKAWTNQRYLAARGEN